MLKFIISLVLTALVSVSIASERIIVLNTNTNNGNAFVKARSFAEDLKNLGYEVQFVSPGNTCQANAFLKTVPPDIPVFVNINVFQADALAGNIRNCSGLIVSEQDLIAVDLDHYYLCTVTQKDDPTALFREGVEFRIGHNTPRGFWVPLLETINSENNANNRIIQYGGTGRQITAMTAGELDYAIVSTSHTFNVEAKGAVCFAEFTKNEPLRYEHTVSDLSAGDAEFDAPLVNSWALKNATDKQVAKLRLEIRALFDDYDSNIIQALGGKTPIQDYGWDVSISERVNWVNDSLKIWTDAVRN